MDASAAPETGWWVEVGDGVLVRRHRELDLSLGLVLGQDRCLVVDTGGDQGQGAEWVAAIRAVTTLPWTVVFTHAHFDHCFGAAEFWSGASEFRCGSSEHHSGRPDRSIQEFRSGAHESHFRTQETRFRTQEAHFRTHESRFGTADARSGTDGDHLGAEEGRCGRGENHPGVRRIHSETDQSARGPKEGRSRAEALGSGAKEPDFRTEESSAGAEKPAFGTEESCFGTEVSSSGTNGPCSGAEEFDSGAAEFRSAPIWAHRGCRSELVATGAAQRETWARHYAEVGRPEVAARIAASELVLPERLVDRRAELDLGGRRVVLAHFGAAHTDHDLVVHLPDDGITFAGDLVEQGAPPAFEDAHPLDWPGVLDAVLALGADVIVPGHGEPVDRGFVQRQRDELAELAELCRAVRAGELTAEQAVARSPYPAEPTRTALARVVTG